MKDEIHFSDEFLNAYLDDELTQADKALLLKAVNEDQVLSQRLCQLQRVKNMVQLAYHDVQPVLEEQPEPGHRPKWFTPYATAASVLLLVGVLGGWLSHGYFSQQPGLTEIFKEFRTNNPVAGKPWHLMVQVTSEDQNRFNVLMDETERLLKTARKKNEQDFIQFLANSSGINLLKDENTALSRRVRSLSQQYNNLLLTACGQTLKKLKLNKKELPKLLGEARVVRSALHEVIEKQKQGWTYIKI